MKTRERLIIKNFGPIASATIDIKPFMVFIGESGSGKSVILKLLSLFRWIYKRQQLLYSLELLTNGNVGIQGYIAQTLQNEISNAGLIDYFQKGSFASYEIDDITFVIQVDTNTDFTITNTRKSKKVSLEKISFITDERAVIPTLLNNTTRNARFPYHLASTYEDFRFAFNELKKGESEQVTIKTMGVNLNSVKSAYEEAFFILQKDKSYKVGFQDSSSGIKSASIVEIISRYYSFLFDKQDIFINFYGKVAPNFIKLLGENFENVQNTTPEEMMMRNVMQNIVLSFEEISNTDARISIFIEEPELNLFPNAQKALVEHLVYSCFEPPKQDKNKTIHIAFSTHSPYMLSSLNCLLLAHEIATKTPSLKEKVESIVPSKFWLDINKFNAFKVENGAVHSIISDETHLILAENIDEVSEEIGETFDKLLELESK